MTGVCKGMSREILHVVYTHLVGFAGKEHGAVADSKRALLLLVLRVDFRDGPCLDGVYFGGRLCLGGRDTLFRVHIRGLGRLDYML